MSLDEILDTLDSFVRKTERRAKDELSRIHFLAIDTAHQIGAMFAGDEGTTAPELWEYFPELFVEEKSHAEKKKQDQQMAVYKAQMQDYAYRHNHARNGGENEWKTE